jgi:hypothetical protein
VSQWAAAVKRRGVAEVATALGLEVRPRSRSLGPCLACQAPRRGTSDPRGPVGLTADGLGWRCHRCHAAGDAVTLAALVAHGTVPEKGDTAGWRAVAAFCEAHGLCTSHETAAPRPAMPRSRHATASPSPPPAPTPAPKRPPEAEVRALWHRCHAVTDDADVCAWLLEGEKRRIDPALVAERDLARTLPRAGPLPAWCVYRGASWRTSSHRVIVPLYGAGGRLESLHARAVAPQAAKDKAASPRDAEVRGLVMADAGGRVLLEGATPPSAGKVIVAEGVPDFLTWATHYGDAAEDAPPVLGMIAGSWTLAIAATIPTGWTVIIRTHRDAAGDAYAEKIRASVAGRCACLRMRVSPYPHS